ncbi:MAG: L,D-transpeptidase [Crocinitomicaceae bacterium]|nr:L,D-transpeptidase [Crocinitomicaceae bacterium]
MRYIILTALILLGTAVYGQTKLQDIVRSQHIPKSELKVLIDKSDYTLSVYHKSKLLITYPCVFGFDAIKDKHQEGDGCTPEGTFGIRSKYAHGSWKYFIWIDYPNKESWSRFNKRKADGVIGSGATIGGEIGIHGVPEGSDSMIKNKTNWTLGCISLTNADITDLYKSIGDGTKIEIVP